MCGIGGFIFKSNIEKTEKIYLINRLFLNLEVRGRDASGLALIDPETNSILILKDNLNASNFIKTEKFKSFLEKNLSDNFKIVLCHTRQATKGDKKNNKNNHPIYNKALNSVLIHNGVISNYDAVKKEYNLETDGECDTEIILKHYEKFKDINKLYTDLSGSFAFALYHNKKLMLFSYSNPLNIAYIKEKDFILFASTSEIIKHTLGEKKIYLGFFEETKKNYNYVMVNLKDNGQYALFKFKNNDFILKKKEAFSITQTIIKPTPSYITGSNNTTLNEWKKDLKCEKIGGLKDPSFYDDEDGFLWGQYGHKRDYRGMCGYCGDVTGSCDCQYSEEDY